MKIISLKDLFKVGGLRSTKWLMSLSVYKNYRDRIEHDLKIKKRAEDDGRNNKPATSDAQPNIVQQQIIHRFESLGDAIKQALWRSLKGAHDLIAERIPPKLEAQAPIEAAELAIIRRKDRAQHALIAAWKHERDRARDFSRFRSANELTGRSATYMQPWPMKPIFLVFAALVFDGFLNGAFFAQRSPEYWQGGVIQALAFSLINVLLGFFLVGFVASRYAGHVILWKRLAGFIGILTGIIAGILFNAYVGHYRQLLETVPLDQIDSLSSGSYIDALAHLREHPFDLSAWQSLVLLILGFAIFVLLAVKGHHADDSYPGYGRHDRVYKQALRQYEARQDKLKEEVDRDIDAVALKLHRQIAREERLVEEAREIFSESEAIGLSNLEELPYVIGLVRQSLEQQLGNGEEA